MKLTKKILEILFPILDKHDRQVFGPMSFDDKMKYWYLPWICLCLLPVVTFWYLFGEGMQPGKVLFSNDGPVGVMNSDWVKQGYPPGEPMWNDLYWVGAGSGRSPIMFTNVFYWICTTPEAFIATTTLVIALIIYALRNRYNKSLLPYEPEGCEEHTALCHTPCDKSTLVFVYRFMFMFFLARFSWVYFASLDKPWIVADILHPVESFIFLGYLLLGLPFWFCSEMEHSEYLRSIRSSK